MDGSPSGSFAVLRHRNAPNHVVERSHLVGKHVVFPQDFGAQLQSFQKGRFGVQSTACIRTLPTDPFQVQSSNVAKCVGQFEECGRIVVSLAQEVLLNVQGLLQEFPTLHKVFQVHVADSQIVVQIRHQSVGRAKVFGSDSEGLLKRNDGVAILSRLQQQKSYPYEADRHIGMAGTQRGAISCRPRRGLEALEGLFPTVTLMEGVLRKQRSTLGVDGAKVVVDTGRQGV
mmetsp:Transcript_16789/g.46051  ORF Transcript_16789/g.46051 Transcript_16789/m.46051 type:complete len:229 (+) Transcript_16789:2760-3446(+)